MEKVKRNFDEMQMYQDLGYKACKFKIGKLKPREDFKSRSCKKGISEDFDLMVDIIVVTALMKPLSFVNLQKI